MRRERGEKALCVLCDGLFLCDLRGKTKRELISNENCK
jgi:hypothetical protein